MVVFEVCQQHFTINQIKIKGHVIKLESHLQVKWGSFSSENSAVSFPMDFVNLSRDVKFLFG